jgi:hypothetical protein
MANIRTNSKGQMEIMDKKARMNNLYNYDSVNDIFDNLFTSLI